MSEKALAERVSIGEKSEDSIKAANLWEQGKPELHFQEKEGEPNHKTSRRPKGEGKKRGSTECSVRNCKADGRIVADSEIGFGGFRQRLP